MIPRSPRPPVSLASFVWSVLWRVSLLFGIGVGLALLLLGRSTPTEPRRPVLDYGTCAPFDSAAWAGYIGGAPDSVAQRYPKVVVWIYGAPPAPSAITYVFDGAVDPCLVYSVVHRVVNARYPEVRS